MPRTRTTKKLAQRIDLNYFRRPSPLQRWRVWLAIGLPALAVVWLTWSGVRRDDTVYSSGRLSASHAVLNSDCAACHVREAGSFSAAATDAACLTCHDGPIHKDNQLFTPTCASCHVDHRGPVRLAETSDQSCAQCHADLRAKAVVPDIARHIESFNTLHPEFAAVRKEARDPGTIKLNHSVHMKKDLRGPDGKPVQMACQDCHRMGGVNQPWPNGEAQPLSAPARAETGTTPLRVASRAAWQTDSWLMGPVKFAQACAACHLLQFDKRFSEGVPHGKQPAELREFLVKKFQTYIASHPSELRVVREPDRTLTGKPVVPAVRLLTPAQWVAERTAEAEELLWRKTCKQCHRISWAQGTALPEIAKPNIPARWMLHAKFSHAAHQMLTCTSCHGATTSKETADVLMPRIATCQSCHNQSASSAESRCFLCHTYHDWSKEKPVRGKFRLREITGGRPLQPGEQKVAIE